MSKIQFIPLTGKPSPLDNAPITRAQLTLWMRRLRQAAHYPITRQTQVVMKGIADEMQCELERGE